RVSSTSQGYTQQGYPPQEYYEVRTRYYDQQHRVGVPPPFVLFASPFFCFVCNI
ncbi:hypothetical protein L195_g035205, partial [Trifolium pratense]